MKMSLLASLCGCVVVCFSLTAYAACVQPPSCEELGFTADASKCEGSFLKCPWDLSKAACKEKGPEAPLLILYGDGTVTKEILSDKTPIGVVFDETNKLAIALTDVKKDGTPGSEVMVWSGEEYNIPNLQNCRPSEITNGFDLTPITCSVDGRINTDEILACNSNDCGETPPAIAVNNYQPTGCIKDFCQKNKWFLPSMRDLRNIYIIKSPLNSSLMLLKDKGAATLTERFYWSSNEYVAEDDSYFSNIAAYFFQMDSGQRNWSTKKAPNGHVRPVINYSDTGGSSCSADYSLATCPKNAICEACGGKYKINNCELGHDPVLSTDPSLPGIRACMVSSLTGDTGTGTGTGTSGSSNAQASGCYYQPNCSLMCSCLYNAGIRNEEGKKGVMVPVDVPAQALACECDFNNITGTGM